MDCHVCIARLRISLNPSIRKQRSACLCGCSQILLVCIVFSGGEALLLNFSIQHRKRVVASYKIPNQICLFSVGGLAIRNAVHSLFMANMWNLSAVGQLTNTAQGVQFASCRAKSSSLAGNGLDRLEINEVGYNELDDQIKWG